MNKYLKEILLFISFLSIILWGLNYYHKKNNNNPPHYKLKFEEVNQNTVKANAIILGTSHAAHSLRPSLLNSDKYRFYNFALNGASPIYFRNWYHKYFKLNYPKPKLCIYVVDWFMLNEGFLWREFEQDSEFLPTSYFLKFLLDKKLDNSQIIANGFPILKNRNLFVSGGRIDLEILNYPISEYDDGFIPQEMKFEEEKFLPIKPSTVELTDIRRQQFDELISSLMEDGVEVAFLMTPEYGLTAEEYNTEINKIIAEIAAQKNIPYLNYNTSYRVDSFNEDRKNFIDWGHLSTVGSFNYSQIVKEDLDSLLHTK